jgi:hypothetical protein
MNGDTTRSEVLTSILGEVTLDVCEEVDECKAFDAVTEGFLEVAAVCLVDLSVPRHVRDSRGKL